MEAKDIKYIVIHCTAGFGELASIKKYWREELEWDGYGYNRIIRINGKTHKLKPFGKVVNGVRGFNHESIHVSYIGGVDPDNYKIAKDTRTKAQKDSLIRNITDALEWLYSNGNDLSNVRILGHRDLASEDKNNNGVIDSWERVKECPSFEAELEYGKLIGRFLRRKKEQAVLTNLGKY